jgi:hypothetical protein
MRLQCNKMEGYQVYGSLLNSNEPLILGIENWHIRELFNVVLYYVVNPSLVTQNVVFINMFYRQMCHVMVVLVRYVELTLMVEAVCFSEMLTM